VGSPGSPAANHLADIRAAGVEALVAVGLFAQGEMLGVLVLASREPAIVDTDEVELLEQLATHAAACLRTVELLGSLRERAASATTRPSTRRWPPRTGARRPRSSSATSTASSASTTPMAMVTATVSCAGSPTP